MKIILLALGLLGADTSAIDKGEGVLEVFYQPRVCVTAPCPMFQVLTVNGTSVDGVWADIVNLSKDKSPIGAFHKIRVTGTWKWATVNGKTSSDLLEVKYKEWEVVIKEVAPDDDSLGREK